MIRMINSGRVALALPGLVLCSLIMPHGAVAQGFPNHWPGGNSTSFSSNSSTNAVGVNISPFGGISIGISNANVSNSFSGGGYGFSLASVPGFQGGTVFANSGNVGVSLNVSENYYSPGSVNIGISNVNVNNSFFGGGFPLNGYHQQPSNRNGGHSYNAGDNDYRNRGWSQGAGNSEDSGGTASGDNGGGGGDSPGNGGDSSGGGQ